MEYRAFMVMPFSSEAVENAFNYVIKPVCESLKIDIRKADEIFSTNPIYDDIVTEIQRADIIIVDITGKNPNVFYELGMAHTLKQKQTIILTNDDYSDAPFDISHFRMIKYKDTIKGKEDLSRTLENTLEYILKEERLLHEDEFQVIEKTLFTSGKQGQIFSILGLYEIGGKIHREKSISGEGHVGSHFSNFGSINTLSGMKPFIEQGYLESENEFYFLTQRGKAFAEYLKDNGYVCDKFNDEILVEDYVPYHEKIKEIQKASDNSEKLVLNK